MTNERGGTLSAERNSLRRPKFGTLLHSDSSIMTNNDDNNYYSRRNSSASASSPMFYDRSPKSGDASPYQLMSPWNQASPYIKSPWTRASPLNTFDDNDKLPEHGLVGSIIREDGHVYSLATADSGDLLYTGSDSKNIRVWKNFKQFSGFKSSSGLVKAIVTSGEKIFTGHQDGKIRVWKFSPKSYRPYKRIGSLPTIKDFVKSSFNPKNYVEVRRHHSVPWIKHFDAVSCMSLDEDQGLLYSGSWDKTLKVWRISDSKCLESINAHDDAVNSVGAGFEGLVFTGSADGSVKAWRRELVGRSSKHVLVQVLLKQDNAVTSLAVNATSAVIYCGSSDGLVNFWEREKHLSHGGMLRGHKLAVLCLAADGDLVFSGSADKSICVWRREEGGVHSCLSVLTGHTGPVKCLAVKKDEEPSTGDQRWIVYSGSLDKYSEDLESVLSTQLTDRGCDGWDINTKITVLMLRYIGILLEGHERLEEEWSICVNQSGPSVSSRSPLILGKLVATCEFFQGKGRCEYATFIKEFWKNRAFQATFNRRNELHMLPRVANYFLNRAVEISRTDYESSGTDIHILYADSITTSNGLASMEFSSPKLTQDSFLIPDDQIDPLIRVQNGP
ncbi:hypothetical protein F0562_028623 [Nyssa sinensis]|uniref:Uncharacterized protein n=1 Tax=Nyssa sinensis TaxID=561372 RepID=A0A5J5AYI4_9ASTE|nr:hypothetical protein F0562_028623 [Nyssa sinensis]